MSISFAPPDSLLRVSAVGIKSDSIFRDFSIRKNNADGQLPISLLQDSTTYLFYFEDRVDTLTLFYERFFNARQSCGYYLDILEPDGPQRYRSTFSDTHVTYGPYTGKYNGLYTTAYGISVRLAKRP